MTNFAKKLEGTTEKELYSWINELDPNFVQLASDELTRRVLNKLGKTIQIFNEHSSKQTRKLIQLTQWIVGLTIVMIFGLGIQVWLANNQTSYTEIQSRSERILQTQAVQKAVEHCEQSPESPDSGLYDVSSGKLASCSVVLQKYKN